MTGEELHALIKAEIGENERLHRILDRIRDGSATFTDSELYAAITAEITARLMRRNVLDLDSREAAFVDITRQRHSDTFTVFSAVQRILDAANGIHIRPQKPPFEAGRAHKIGHSLEDKTVPDSTIQRRAESATENFCRSHHDDCMKVNAQFRDRAGLQAYAIRDGSAKCCDWCADVSGKYPVNETPAGFWGRHDNCKCSIQYDAKKGGRQTLRGTSKKWEKVAPDAGAGPLVRLTKEQAQALQEKYKLTVLTPEQAKNAGAEPLFFMSNSFRPTYEQKQTSFPIGNKNIIGFRVHNSEFELYSDTPERKNKAVRIVEKALRTVQPNLPQGFSIPPVVVVDFEKYGLNLDRQGNAHDVIGGFASESGILFINSRYNTKKKILAFVTKNKGQFANQTEYAPILHELGHKYYEDSVKRLASTKNISYNEAKNIIDSKIYEYISTRNSDGRFVRNNISGYAATGYDCHSYTEIVAECFSATNDNTVASELLDLLTGVIL